MTNIASCGGLKPIWEGPCEHPANDHDRAEPEGRFGYRFATNSFSTF
jgi:hypothetical protein